MEKEEIRVLHLISSSGFLGAENVVLELAKQSKAAGHQATIGVFENQRNPHLELAEAAAAEGLNVQIFPCRGRWDKKTLQMIKDYINKENIQIIHSHNYKSNFYARMALSGNNIRWVVTNHGRRTGHRLLIYSLLNFLILRRADKIIAVSEKIAGQMERAGINKEKVRIIDNGININRLTNPHGLLPQRSMKIPPYPPLVKGGWGDFHIKKKDSIFARESLKIKPDALVIGTVGSLTKEKGQEYLIKAAPKVIESFPKAVFLFVGEGIERTHLEKISFKLGIKDKPIFAGTRKDIPEILSILDVFVLPSLKEGLPMALLEAQAAKVPTVASRVGAIPNVVKDDATGILVPPKDSEAIGQAIIRILSDQNAASKMAEKGFERVRDNFSSERMADKYLSMYRELLSG